MSKFRGSTVAIILGIIIFLIGFIQYAKYEEAKENGHEVDATIVEVVKKEETDSEGSYTSMSYTVYADYELEGKKYEHVKVGKYYDTDAYYIGKVITVVVNPDSPGKPMFEGGILGVVGGLVLCYGIIAKIKNKKTT